MVFTVKDEEVFKQTSVCHICGLGGFATLQQVKESWEKDQKPHPDGAVRDHDHFTGKFRGKAHHSCNLNYQHKNIFACFFHNLKGYDSHFILQEIRESDCNNIKAIAINSEKVLSFFLTQRCGCANKCRKQPYEIRFVDSMSFLSASLETLTEGLSFNQFHYTKNFVSNCAAYQNKSALEKMLMVRLMNQKGFYPYEYMNRWERFEESSLPAVSAFVSKLVYETSDFGKLPTKEQETLKIRYKHATNVFKTFECQHNGDYHDLYLRSDVALLTDNFEAFRTKTLEKFGLDPCNYYTLPGLAFDAMLKMTGMELELIKDPDKYLMMEAGKIGGISGTGGIRYAKANNPYVAGYDKTKKPTYLIYCDANALYGWGMTEKLPVSHFEWIDPADWNEKGFRMNKNTDGEYSYWLEVDAHLPQELHDKHNDFPCFPENIGLKYEQLSQWQQETLGTMGKKLPQGKKLIPNLNNKKNYVVHLKLLQQWEKLGWVVTKVHRVQQFRHKAFMKPFIDMCSTERQKDGITDFEKDFWKFFGNANFGKLLENIRKHSNIKLVTSANLQKSINRPDFQDREKINNNGIFVVKRAKQSVVLNKPIYAGVAVLNNAKYKMYDFWYNVLQKKYGSEKLKMVYTDTDSFIFSVETDDFYKDLQKDKEFAAMWDFSNYPTDHPLYDKSRKKVPGLFKDEMSGVKIAEVVALRAKMYSIKDVQGNQKNTGKGIKKGVLKDIKHDDYFRAQFHNGKRSNYAQSAKMTQIRSHKHNVVTETGIKQTLSCFDDKKYILDDGITQYSHGHWRIGFLEMAKIYDAVI